VVEAHRAELRRFGTDPAVAAGSLAEYRRRLGTALLAICDEAAALARGQWDRGTFELAVAAVARGAEHWFPVYRDQATRRGGTILQWLAALPRNAAAVLPPTGRAHLPYTDDVVRSIASQAASTLTVLVQELTQRPPPGAAWQVVDEAGLRRRFDDAVAALHRDGVDSAHAADEMASVTLYSTDILDGVPWTAPASTAVDWRCAS
jgi:hypothetical protein